MKHMMKKIAVVLSLSLIVGVSIPTFYSDAQVDCSTYTNQNIGNLIGYALASNLPSDGNKIFMSYTDDDWEGGVEYGVKYDRSSGIFSGRAWNETLGWIDFDVLNDIDKADALSPDGSFAWGGYEGTIEGLQTVVYSNNDGTFSAGEAVDAQYVSGQSQGDVQVGMGLLDFSNVTFDPNGNLIPDQCKERVDVLVNGRSSTNIGACNQTASISWNSQQVSNCQTAGNAPWNNPGARATTSSGENSGLITSGNSGSLFRIQCTGNLSGDIVMGSAQVRCGAETVCTGSNCLENADVNNFQFIES